MRYQVGDDDTAIALGSGDVPVLATPRLIAWLEAATVDAARRFVQAGQTSVGTAVRVEHRRPTAVGAAVEVTAAWLSDDLLGRPARSRRSRARTPCPSSGRGQGLDTTDP